MGKRLDTFYFECECQCPEHIGRVVYEKYNDGGPDEIYIDILLNPYLNVFKRIYIAFKYIFKLGYANLCHFDTLIIHKEDVPKLIEVLKGIEHNG